MMSWVRKMNSVRSRVQEIVMTEVILMFGAEPRDLLCQKSFLRPAACQHGNSVHSVPPFSCAIVGVLCFQYTDRHGLFKPFSTKAPFPSRNPIFGCDITGQLCYNQDERVYKGGWKL